MENRSEIARNKAVVDAYYQAGKEGRLTEGAPARPPPQNNLQGVQTRRAARILTQINIRNRDIRVGSSLKPATILSDRHESRRPSHDRNRFSRLINFPDRFIGSRKNDLNGWRYRAPTAEAVLSAAPGLTYAARSRQPIRGPIAAGLQLEN
jgi:hypothetical protein